MSMKLGNTDMLLCACVVLMLCLFSRGSASLVSDVLVYCCTRGMFSSQFYILLVRRL
jgi:hypothetical protein